MNIRNDKFKIASLSFTVILLIVTLLLVVLSGAAVLNYMVEYEYHINQNFDKSDIVMSLNSRDAEISAILFYLKALIAYFFVVIGYLWYRIDVSKDEKKQMIQKGDIPR